MIDDIGQAIAASQNRTGTMVSLNKGMIEFGKAAKEATEALNNVMAGFEKIAAAHRPGLDIKYTVSWEE